MFECSQCGNRKTSLSAAPGSEAEALMGERRWDFGACTFCRYLRFFRRCEGGDSKMVEPSQEAHKCDAAEGLKRLRVGDSIGDVEGWSSDGGIAIATKPVLWQAYCKAQGGVPMPTKSVPMPRQDLIQDSYSDSEASSTVTLMNIENRSVYEADNVKLRSERSANEIPQKRNSLRPRMKCQPKAMRWLARTRLDVNHLLKKTKMELRKLEEQQQALENMTKEDANKRQSGGAKSRDSVQRVGHLIVTVSTVMRCSYQPMGHPLVDYQSLNVEQVGLSQTKTLYLDPKALQLNEATCIMLYQVKDKTTDSQTEQKEDLLPVLVMAARTKFSDSHDLSQKKKEEKEEAEAEEAEFLLVWLSSFQQPNGFRISGTLSVCSPLGDTLTVLTAQLYDISAPKHMAAIFRSPSTLIVPHVLLQRMTISGQDLIAIQVRFH